MTDQPDYLALAADLARTAARGDALLRLLHECEDRGQTRGQIVEAITTAVLREVQIAYDHYDTAQFARWLAQQCAAPARAGGEG